MTATTPGPEHLTDLGNAQRFVRLHGNDSRFVRETGKWIHFQGHRWVEDPDGSLAIAKAIGVCREMHAAAALAEDAKERRFLAQHALRSESERGLRAMTSISEKLLSVSTEELDKDDMLLGVQRGVVDLVTGTLVPAERGEFVTKSAGTHFEPGAEAPQFRAFLERILPDPDVRDFVRRAVGYSLTGRTDEQCMFVNHGSGANGKTTLVEVVAALLGDYAKTAAPETLLARRDGANSNDLARLRGARFVSACETDEGRRLAESRVKQLTGGDRISARFLHREFFDFRPKVKLWLSTNHRPEIRGTDAAIWRRIKLIPFTESIPPAEQDTCLLDTLVKTELPGILNWALQGCSEWNASELAAPRGVREATAEYRDAEDSMAAFLGDACVTGDGRWVASGALLAAYKDFSGESSISAKRLAARMLERGFLNSRRGKGGRRVWLGVGLRADGEGASDVTS